MLQELHDYHPFGKTMRSYSLNENERFLFTGKERDSEINYDYFGARYYDSDVGRFLSVDPLADAPANVGTSPYAYVWNNPLKFIDPDGRHGQSVDDFIFRAEQEDGSYKEIGRIEAEGDDVVYNIDYQNASKYGLDKLEGANYSLPRKAPHNFQAVSINISAEAAYKGGAQVELSIIGMTAGPDKGEWGIALQGNALLGLEGGVTGSMSLYQPTEGRDLFLENLSGFEMGLQGDIVHQAGSVFAGYEFNRKHPLGKQVYTGFSYGLAFGSPQVPGGFSGYAGYSAFLYDTKSSKKTLRP